MSMDLHDLYNNGMLTRHQYAEMVGAARRLEQAFDMTPKMAHETLAQLGAAMYQPTFVDDDREPTEEELAIHLSEMDEMEDTLARLEDDHG